MSIRSRILELDLPGAVIEAATQEEIATEIDIENLTPKSILITINQLDRLYDILRQSVEDVEDVGIYKISKLIGSSYMGYIVSSILSGNSHFTEDEDSLRNRAFASDPEYAIESMERFNVPSLSADLYGRLGSMFGLLLSHRLMGIDDVQYVLIDVLGILKDLAPPDFASSLQDLITFSTEENCTECPALSICEGPAGQMSRIFAGLLACICRYGVPPERSSEVQLVWKWLSDLADVVNDENLD